MSTINHSVQAGPSRKHYPLLNIAVAYCCGSTEAAEAPDDVIYLSRLGNRIAVTNDARGLQQPVIFVWRVKASFGILGACASFDRGTTVPLFGR